LLAQSPVEFVRYLESLYAVVTAG